MIPHPHLWRRMTAEQDYAVGGPNWGQYHGFEEEICRLCGIKREVKTWQRWRYELDDAESRVKYLLEIDPQPKEPPK